MRCPPVCARRVFFSLLPPPPRYPLFPYTTLFRSPKILVVDDDPAISEMLTIVLESEGLQPIPITDGNDAVPAFEDRKSTRLNSSHVAISYAVFCVKKKINERGARRAGILPKQEIE